MSEINFLNILQVLIAIAMIGFILIQRGPGATAGSAFGGGASGTVFGAKGSGSFLTKATAILATAFFIITMLIAIDSSETYASTGDAAEQDLGVFGSLDDAEPGMIPTDATTPVNNNDVLLKDATNDVIKSADDGTNEAATEIKQAADNAAETVQETAEDAAKQIEQATDSTDDSDGGGKY